MSDREFWEAPRSPLTPQRSVVREIQQSPVAFNIVKDRRHPGRWITTALLAAIGVAVAASFATNENFHWDVVGRYLFNPQVLRGVGWTVLLTVLSMLLAVALAIALVFMRQSDNPIASRIAWLWIWFFRGTPVYTQLVFWGLLSVLYPRLTIGIPFGLELLSVSTRDYMTPAIAAVIGLGLRAVPAHVATSSSLS